MHADDSGWLAGVSRFVREHVIGMAIFAIVTTVAAQYIGDRLNGRATPESPETTRAKPQPPPRSLPQPPPQQQPSSSDQRRVRDVAPVYINPAAIASRQTLVIVVDDGFQPHPELTALIGDSLRANAGAFTDAFARGDGMRKAFDGDVSELRAIPRIEGVPLILLGRARLATSSNQAVMAGLLKADLQLSVRVYRPSEGFATELLFAASIGAGFSEAGALANAAEKIARELESRLSHR